MRNQLQINFPSCLEECPASSEIDLRCLRARREQLAMEMLGSVSCFFLEAGFDFAIMSLGGISTFLSSCGVAPLEQWLRVCRIHLLQTAPRSNLCSPHAPGMAAPRAEEAVWLSSASFPFIPLTFFPFFFFFFISSIWKKKKKREHRERGKEGKGRRRRRKKTSSSSPVRVS